MVKDGAGGLAVWFFGASILKHAMPSHSIVAIVSRGVLLSCATAAVAATAAVDVAEQVIWKIQTAPVANTRAGA